MIRPVFFCILLLGLVSCGSGDKPSGLLDAKKMQAVLWDVIRADAFTAEFIKKDSSKNAVAENEKLQQQIFAIHKITKSDFYKSYDYYKSNTTEFKVILDSMIAQAGNNRKTFNKPVMAE